jgi:hypothetical protein
MLYIGLQYGSSWINVIQNNVYSTICKFITPVPQYKISVVLGQNMRMSRCAQFLHFVYSIQRTLDKTFKVQYCKIPLICHLTIWNPDNPALEESSPKTGSFAFHKQTNKQKASSVKQADLRDMFKKASKNVCTSTDVVSPDHMSPTPSTSSVMKTPENTEEDPDDPQTTHEGDIQMEYSSD